jgi:U3 small nucleolar RNA-associated protein 10
LREYLEILNTAVDKNSKSIVTKNSSTLSSIFLKALDLRRQWTLAGDEDYTPEAMSEIENMVNDVGIKMIYKFNDSTFRPIFSKLVEWAASALPKKDKTGRSLRLQSLFAFLAVFFGNLKSIVTSYATYFLENAVEALTTVDPKDDDSRDLWTKVLGTLVQCFQHDQDDFWQSPSHFDAMASALHAQFLHAANLPLVSELIPAIVELAVVADSAEHHKEFNSAILKHTRSETAAVRLAAVQCEQALTDRLGEEWLSMLPEMLPFISELQEDDDDIVEKETQRWIVKIEGVLGERLDSMLQ